ncbi:MAG: carboxypeptidase regulatory-like domain-containing protein [Acidobacteria bacterium]|nr:MAG: carboxypeptidase regulatory-like domain-containing protein [Acidobacteriota bacterium]
MRGRSAFLLAVVFVVATAATGFAQQPGEIYGKVTDGSGAVMPGVTATLTGSVLLEPMVAATSASGAYRFPGLAVGVYTVTFEIPGFKTYVRNGIRIEIGANVSINAALEISALQEVVTVSGATPLVDLRDTSKSNRFTQEVLQSIPSARDPWVIIEQSAGVAMDRSNVGGSASGQQSNFVARGALMSQQKWNLDGVDVTDMNATGGSPVYFDFDAFEEMQISTGGSDVTMQSPGVAVNLVTKSGTDRLRGSGRYYVTDQKFEAVNLNDAIRRQGATSGNPIQRITDYGTEAGGPIRKGRAWFWGSYGKQDINIGVNGFYKSSAACQALKADVGANALSRPVEEIWGCLNTDLTTLNNYNAKVAIEPLKNNLFSFFFNGAEKVRNARNASDTHPIETTWRQGGVSDPSLGSSWWKTGMPKTYKWSDRHVLSDRFMVELQYAHVGNNFVLDFHEPSLAGVQGT